MTIILQAFTNLNARPALALVNAIDAHFKPFAKSLEPHSSDALNLTVDEYDDSSAGG
jgi:hypothetical protein